MINDIKKDAEDRMKKAVDALLPISPESARAGRIPVCSTE